MRRISTRLLITQISISFIISFVLGISTLWLARDYFLDSLESAMDTQAVLISEALDPEAQIQAEASATDTAFNTMQQQVGNLSVEIQGMNTDPALPSFTMAEFQPQIEAFEAIDLAVAYVDGDGQLILMPDRVDLPPLFGSVSNQGKELQGKSTATLEHGSNTSWLVKSYVLARESTSQGFLTLGQPLDAVEAVLVDLGWMIAIAGVIAIGIATIFSILSSRGLLAPIAALTRASRSLSQGRFDGQLPLDRRDELGELSRTFEDMRSKLEALEKLRAQFVSDVSHELRTPLTAIKGLTETLQDGAVDDAEVRDRFLASIEQETDRLIRMTQDLLTLTRIDGQSLVMHPAPLDLLDVLSKTLLILNPAIKAKQLEVATMTVHQELPVEADPDRLVQILFNLLDNAIHHAPPLSEIKIKIQHGTLSDAPILAILRMTNPCTVGKPTIESIKGDTPWAMIQIQDNGPGIQSYDLPHVFERFYRADTARTRVSGGAGLGLSIAQALVREHSGYLWLYSPVHASTDGQLAGTLAILMLPASALI